MSQPISSGPPTPEPNHTLIEHKPVSWGSKIRDFFGRVYKSFADLPKNLLSLVAKVSSLVEAVWEEYEQRESWTPPAFPKEPVVPSPVAPFPTVVSTPLPASTPISTPLAPAPSTPAQPTPSTPAPVPKKPFPSAKGKADTDRTIGVSKSFFSFLRSDSAKRLPLINVPRDGSCYYYSVILGIMRSGDKALWDKFTEILKATQTEAEKKGLQTKKTWDFSDPSKSFEEWVNDFIKKRRSLDTNMVGDALDNDMVPHAELFQTVMRLLRYAIADFVEGANTNPSLSEADKQLITDNLDGAIVDDPDSVKIPDDSDDSTCSVDSLYHALDRAKSIYQSEFLQEETQKAWREQITQAGRSLLTPSLLEKQTLASQLLDRSSFPANLAEWLGISQQEFNTLLEKLPGLIKERKLRVAALEQDKERLQPQQRKDFLRRMRTSGQWGNALQTQVLRLLFTDENNGMKQETLGVRIWGPNQTLKATLPEKEPKVVIDIFLSQGHYQTVKFNSPSDAQRFTPKEQSTPTAIVSSEVSNFEKLYNGKLQFLINLKRATYQNKIKSLLSVSPPHRSKHRAPTKPKPVVPTITSTPKSQPKPISPTPPPTGDKLSPKDKLLSQINKTIANISKSTDANIISIKTTLTALLDNTEKTDAERYHLFREQLDILKLLVSTEVAKNIVFAEIPELAAPKKSLPEGAILTPSDGSCAIYALCLSSLVNEEAADKLKTVTTEFNTLRSNIESGDAIRTKEYLIKNGVPFQSGDPNFEALKKASAPLRKMVAESLEKIANTSPKRRSDQENAQVLRMQIAAENALLSDSARKPIIDAWKKKKFDLEKSLKEKYWAEHVEKITQYESLIKKNNDEIQLKEIATMEENSDVAKKEIKNAIKKLNKHNRRLHTIIKRLNTEIDQGVQNTCDHILEKQIEEPRYKEYYESFMDYDQMCKKAGYADSLHLEKGYAKMIANSSSYLDDISIEELSTLLGIRIQVFQKSSDEKPPQSIQFCNQDKQDWPTVSMFFEANHYSAYIPPELTPPSTPASSPPPASEKTL